MTLVNRRSVLIAGAAMPTALAAIGITRADSHESANLAATGARSFRLGAFEVTTLLAGTTLRDGPRSIFGISVPAEEFGTVSAENFVSAETLQFYYTPTVVRAGEDVILFDTGLNAASMAEALAQAGYQPTDITHVVITHMHPDHIGGMITEVGELTYANATYVTGQAEFDAWAAMDNGDFDAKVRPFTERFAFIGDGGTVSSGITAMAAFGHTPGHMTYMLESGGRQILLVADLVGHYVWSFANPDWDMRFDSDKVAANATRRRVLDMLATDRMPMIGYHMPFPAVGFVETRGDGFRFVPVSYQLMG